MTTLVSGETVRDHALNVSGGAVTKVKRVNTSGNQRNKSWIVTIEPSGNADVEISVATTTDCTATRAICTSDGRKLSSNDTMTVPGP